MIDFGRGSGVSDRLVVVSVFVSLITLSYAWSLFVDFMPALFGGYSDQRLIQCFITLCFVFLLFFTSAQARRQIIDKPEFWAVLLLVSWLIGVSYFGQESKHSWVEPIWYGTYFLAFICGGSLLSSSSAVKQVSSYFLTCAILSCFLYGVMAINIYIFMLLDGNSRLREYIPWGFVNIRYWSHLATWLVPLLALASLQDEYRNKQLWKLLIHSGAALWWWMLFLSSSRGSILGVIFGVFLVFVFWGKQTFIWIRAIIFQMFCGVSLWLILSFAVPGVLFESTSSSSMTLDDDFRVPQIIEAWTMSFQEFPLGMGPQSWLTHELLTEEYQEAPKYAHPHNMYLMWAAEYGWGFVVLLLLLVVIGARYFFCRRAQLTGQEARHDRLILMGYTASVSGALFHAGVSSVFIAPASMMIGVFVLSIFWGLVSPSLPMSDGVISERSIHLKRSRASVFAAFSLMIFVSGFWVAEIREYHSAMKLDRENSIYGKSKGNLPRFWLHGNYPRGEKYMQSE